MLLEVPSSFLRSDELRDDAFEMNLPVRQFDAEHSSQFIRRQWRIKGALRRQRVFAGRNRTDRSGRELERQPKSRSILHYELGVIVP